MDAVAEKIREDIDAAEAAIYGDPDTGLAGLAGTEAVTQEDENTSSESQNSAEATSEDSQQGAEDSDDSQPEANADKGQGQEQQQDASPTTQKSTPDPRAHWAPLERRAVELRERNPDMSLEASYAQARHELGLDAEDNSNDNAEDSDSTPEPTLEEQIAAIEAKLDEEGANEGLFTKEIAELTKQHSRLVAKLEVSNAEESKVQASQQEHMIAERAASVERVQNLCPDSRDPDTAIGQAMGQVIAELSNENNPILYRADAPEQIFHLANARLPEAERYEVARKATTQASAPEDKPNAGTQSPKGETTAPNTAQTDEHAEPSVASVAPVSGGLRSAQPAVIPLARVPDVIRATDADTLEEALYGDRTGSEVFMRL